MFWFLSNPQNDTKTGPTVPLDLTRYLRSSKGDLEADGIYDSSVGINM